MPATWPAALPQFVQEQGYGETLPDQAIESQVDNGPPKTRRRFTKNLRPIQAVIQCDSSQRAVFDNFYIVTLEGGTQPFLWVNPFTQKLALFRFRRPPPVYTPFGAVHASISMTLWQLAQYADLRFDSTEVAFDSTLRHFDESNIY